MSSFMCPLCKEVSHMEGFCISLSQPSKNMAIPVTRAHGGSQRRGE